MTKLQIIIICLLALAIGLYYNIVRKQSPLDYYPTPMTIWRTNNNNIVSAFQLQLSVNTDGSVEWRAVRVK